MFGRLRPLRFNWEIAPYLLLVAIALVMRLWDLGSAAITHDESLHAMYSWYLYQDWPQGYEHMPMMHGPFQFFGTAVNFFLFGDSDFTARLLPALFGAALVALLYFLRRQLGRWGSLAVAIFLAFSPTLLYFSRYARTDIYIAFLTLLLVIFMWRYFEQRKARYLYFSAAALSLSFCTKEVSYLTVAIFASFLLIASAVDLISRVKSRLDLRDLSAPAEYLILLGTLSLPLFCALLAAAQANLASGLEKVFIIALLSLLCALFLTCAIIGFRRMTLRLLISTLIFYGIFTLLYTSLFTNLSGFASGIWDTVDYWVAQQDVARGGQPWYYYFLLLSWYEFLPLILAAIGAIYFIVNAIYSAAKRGLPSTGKTNLFSWFLIYWMVASLATYSWSGEKMPWLSLHMALPMILLGGMFIGGLFQEVDWRRVRAVALRAATALILILLFSFTVHIALEASYDQDESQPKMLVYAGISADVPQIMDQIEELAEERGEEKELAITVDSPLSWPWVWYLRDYKNVDYPNLSAIGQPPRGAVLLLSAGNEQAAQPYLDKYGEGQEFRHRLWFPEEYREYKLFDSDGWRWWWDYLLHRETLGPYWSTEGIAYFPGSSP